MATVALLQNVARATSCCNICDIRGRSGRGPSASPREKRRENSGQHFANDTGADSGTKCAGGCATLRALEDTVRVGTALQVNAVKSETTGTIA